ncbi:MAG: S1C family serine protease [bacterium]|nr:S1C family serine protease [bacterium]
MANGIVRLTRILRGGFIAGISAAVIATPQAASAQLTNTYRPDSAVSTAVAIVRPSVVAIETRFKEPTLKDEYSYWQQLRGARPLYGLWGSGIIYKDPQYVVTTAFLMDEAEFIRVVLDDGRSYSATLVGKNDDLEVAVLKVDWGPDLSPTAPPFGDSDVLRLGQPIAVVGKALNSVDTYTSFGVVSAIRKEVPGTDKPTDQFLQFDASYELSFVGGPMVDVNGNVVGMVDRTVQDFRLTNINLAVPINEVISSADRIISGDNKDTWFGVEQRALTPIIQQQGHAPLKLDINGDGRIDAVDYGTLVTYVDPLSPADIAGIKPGDFILRLDNKRIKYAYDWDSTVRDFRVGQLVDVDFARKSADGVWERLKAQVQILLKAEEEDEAATGGSGGGSGSYHHHSTKLGKGSAAGRNRNAVFTRRGGQI